MSAYIAGSVRYRSSVGVRCSHALKLSYVDVARHRWRYNGRTYVLVPRSSGSLYEHIERRLDMEAYGTLDCREGERIRFFAGNNLPILSLVRFPYTLYAV